MIYITPDKLNSNFVPSIPTRVLGTPFQPSVDRPVLVQYSIKLTCTSTLLGQAIREVELRSDENNPPTTVRGRVRNRMQGVAATNEQGTSLIYFVPKGHWVNLVSVNSNGIGSIVITDQVETPF